MRVSLLSLALLLPLPSLPQDKPPAPGLPTLAQLIADLHAREKAASTVHLEMRTKGAFGPGREFNLTGTIRVLGATHVHIKTQADFGPEMKGETEMVKTPEGIWMREVDPIQGPVHTFTSAELAGRLEAASKAIGKQGAVPNQANAPLGSAMLESMSQTFDLKVERRLVYEGLDYYVVKGKSRGHAPTDPMLGDMPQAEEVEILVGVLDASVRRMVQFREGKPMLTIEITKLVLDTPMDKGSFTIQVEPGVRFKDVMEHPPAAEQIRRILDEAAAKKPAATQPESRPAAAGAETSTRRQDG
ncbi:MAG: hypothetical protein IT458_01960 [Planctomycetes bacterium]|nr:hypothetical protein [Planctomycetota bacterium]